LSIFSLKFVMAADKGKRKRLDCEFDEISVSRPFKYHKGGYFEEEYDQEGWLIGYSEHEGANYEEEYCAEGLFIGYKYKGDKAGYVGRQDTNEADYSDEESSNVQVYVDDIIFGSTKKEMCTEFEKMMHKKFQMSSMGELTSFLGFQVTQKDDGIFLSSQDKYVHEILKKFGFSTVKTANTLMETSKPLMKDKNAEDVDVHLYRSMIGSLMYLTSSRPDIMFVVCACARFQVTPKVSHLYAVKKIFRYLKGQPKLGLWKEMCTKFEKMMHKKFQMSSMGELTFFLGFQVTQKDDVIFLGQDKYVHEILKKFGFSTVKTASTPMETSKPLMKDENVEDVDVHLYRLMIGSLIYLTFSRPDIMFVDSSFELKAYTDSDYAGANLDRKFTIGGCQFLGR
nr:uncharacterized mitochondrial protein AtMg00810-like [Tanacetum cinerariifolium]